MSHLATTVVAAASRLRRAPLFTVAAVASLGLGIGANATLLDVVYRMYFAPPPQVADPERVVQLHVANTTGAERRLAAFSYPAYRVLRDVGPTITALGLASYPTDVPLGRGEAGRDVSVLLIDAGYWRTFDVRPMLGRFFGPEHDGEASADRVAVISAALWRDAFGSDPDILGRPIDLGASRYIVIGVAPPRFAGAEERDVAVWVPIAAADGLRFVESDWREARGSTWLRLYARLAPAATATAVGAAMTRTVHEAGVIGGDRSTWHIAATPLTVLRRSGEGSRFATTLAGVALLVVVLAAANVGGLFVARAMRERRALGVRIALGETRGRRIGHAAADGALVGLGGGVVGATVSVWLLDGLRSTIFADLAWTASTDWVARSIGAVLVAVALAVPAAVLPALTLADRRLTASLVGAARGQAFVRSPARSILLAMQAALSLALLIGTGLFIASLRNLQAMPLGWRPDGVLLATMNLSHAGVGRDEADAIFTRAALRLLAQPGVAAAGVTTVIPFGASYGTRLFSNHADSVGPGGSASLLAVTTPLFGAMGVRVVEGRLFQPHEESPRATSGAASVALLNRTAAARLAPGGSAVGQCVRVGADTAPCSTVVGVVDDVRLSGLTERADAQVYVPLGAARADMRTRFLVVRATRGAALATAVRTALREVRPGLPPADVRPMDTVLVDELRQWRLGALAFAAYGSLALVLVGLGLYGVVSYTSEQRTTEIGVRRALGASRTHVAGVVVRHAIHVLGAGLVVGAALAATGAYYLRDVLVGVHAFDVGVWSVAAVLVAVVAAMACAMPTWRALRIAPSTAMRAE